MTDAEMTLKYVRLEVGKVRALLGSVVEKCQHLEDSLIEGKNAWLVQKLT